MDTIFVQIPAYRDSELIPTLCDLADKAQYPERLRVSVCWQHGEESSIDDFLNHGFEHLQTSADSPRPTHFLTKHGAHIHVQEFHFTESRGCGWARAITQALYQGENYALQIDSHQRFLEHWDSVLVHMLEQLRGRSRWPLLTGYPYGYNPLDQTVLEQDGAVQMDFSRFGGNGLVLFQASKMESAASRSEPMRARFFSAGFCFSDGHFVKNVPYDPRHFFATEEISMTVRAFTSGYDLYHPHRNVIWHYYIRDGAPKIWSDHSEEAVMKGVVEAVAEDRAQTSLQLLKNQLGLSGADGKADVDDYELGWRRSLLEYERYAGISFKHLAATQDALDRKEPSLENLTHDCQEWEANLIKMTDVALKIDDLNKFFRGAVPYYGIVRVLDADGLILTTYEFNSEDIASVIKTGCLKIHLQVSSGLSNQPDFCVLTIMDFDKNNLVKMSFDVET